MPDLNTLLNPKKSIKSVCEHVRTFAKKFGSFLWRYCIRIAAYLHRTVMHRRGMHSREMHWRSMDKGAMHRSAMDSREIHWSAMH
jgi:hypothetical protein